MALPGFLIRHISSFIYPKPFLHMIILCSCTRICLNQLRNLPNIHCMQQLCKYGLDLIWENEKSKIITAQSSCLGIHFNEYLRLGVWRVKIILDAYISLSDVNEISEKFPIHISRYSFFDHCFYRPCQGHDFECKQGTCIYKLSLFCDIYGHWTVSVSKNM